MNKPDHSKSRPNCFYLRIVAVLFWSAGLIVISLIPSGNSHFFFSGQDKVLHFLAYLLTAWLACRSLLLFSVSTKKAVIISVIYCILLGGILELLQHTATLTRTAEWYDLLANIAGAICGCAVFCLQQRLFYGHNEPE